GVGNHGCGWYCLHWLLWGRLRHAWPQCAGARDRQPTRICRSVWGTTRQPGTRARYPTGRAHDGETIHLVADYAASPAATAAPDELWAPPRSRQWEHRGGEA